MNKRNILLSKAVFNKMENLTVKYSDCENGGFIFGRMNPKSIQVLDVSDAGNNAKRTFSKVEFDGVSLLEYVQEKVLFEQFLIGTWHSHPEGHSLFPSMVDQSTMKSINAYFDNAHAPIFFITGIRNGNFEFVIYKIDNFGSVVKEMNYEIID